MQASPETTAPRRFFSIGDAVFLFAVAAIAPTMAAANLKDPGLGWHLRNIDAMREAGGWLHTDPFSRVTDAAWYSNQWIGDLALWLGFHWAGWNGVAAVALVALGFVYRHVYRCLSEDGSPWPVALLWTFAAMLGSYIGWVARPNIATPLLLFVTLRACSMFHDGRRSPRSLLLLLPMFTLWANLHGGFLAGVISLVAVLGIEAAIGLFAQEADGRGAARQRALVLAAVTAGAVAATLLNPYGWKLYPWCVKLVTSDVSMFNEFQSPDFNWGTWKGAARYEFFVLAFPALMAVSRWRPNLVAVGLSVLWLHLALQTRRILPLWVLSVTPLLARAFLDIDWLNRFVARIPLSEDFREILSKPSAPSAPWASLAMGAAVIALAAYAPPMDLHKGNEAAVRELVALNDGHAVIFHDLNWGGDLVLAGWDATPRFRTWIDDRYDVHGAERTAEYLKICRTEAGWKETVDRLGIDVIGIGTNWPLAERLASNPGWTLVQRDDEAVVFRRSKD